MSTPRARESNRIRVARWRARNLERARAQWRDSYRRKKRREYYRRAQIALRRRLEAAGVDWRAVLPRLSPAGRTRRTRRTRRRIAAIRRGNFC